jgi:hypothetical protein
MVFQRPRMAHLSVGGSAMVGSLGAGRDQISCARLWSDPGEQPGFETSVTLAKYVDLSRGKVRPKKVDRSGLEPSHHLSGTDGSNPAPSSSESDELPTQP